VSAVSAAALTEDVALQIWQIRARQAYPRALKIEIARQRIRTWYQRHGGRVVVSFSGGKDSVALLHLVREMYPDVPAVFVDTGMEYPEVRAVALAASNLEVLRPDKSFRQVIKEYGWPVIGRRQSQFIKEAGRAPLGSKLYAKRMRGCRPDGTQDRLAAIPKCYRYLVPLVRAGVIKISDSCCDVMKKRPLRRYQKATGRAPYLGIMADESQNRLMSWMRYGCNVFETKNPMSRPLMAWSTHDVLCYIREHDLSLAECYGEIVEGADGQLETSGLSGTGCMFCGFGAHLEERPNRFEVMADKYPKRWDYIVNRLGGAKVFDLVGIPYKPVWIPGG